MSCTCTYISRSQGLNPAEDHWATNDWSQGKSEFDDTTLLEIVDDPTLSAGPLSSDLNKIAVWADKWLATKNPVKSPNVVIFSEV